MTLGKTDCLMLCVCHPAGWSSSKQTTSVLEEGTLPPDGSLEILPEFPALAHKPTMLIRTWNIPSAGLPESSPVCPPPRFYIFMSYWFWFSGELWLIRALMEYGRKYVSLQALPKNFSSLCLQSMTLEASSPLSLQSVRSHASSSNQ